ncbi:hypothetical protein Pint_33475 [Pistacia integerrima]|uniref:Uncharacterized protein n=1 Tax=Pistacia integerrima TaxID=434235 RepID=A0ACC0X236_9ROSI|nr:hypothetical protein Pint_33475 [Pistacia integerrima]
MVILLVMTYTTRFLVYHCPVILSKIAIFMEVENLGKFGRRKNPVSAKEFAGKLVGVLGRVKTLPKKFKITGLLGIRKDFGMKKKKGQNMMESGLCMNTHYWVKISLFSVDAMMPCWKCIKDSSLQVCVWKAAEGYMQQYWFNVHGSVFVIMCCLVT